MSLLSIIVIYSKMKNLIITSFDYYLYSCNDIYIVFDKNNNSKN